MQFEADMVGVPVKRTTVSELSAMGVAHLAGVGAGLFTFERLSNLDRGGQSFEPRIADEIRRNERAAWTRAVNRARGRPIN